MKLRIPFALLVVFTLLFSGFKFQEDKLKLLLDRFTKFGQEAYQEKIYLHTDKPYYAIGDDIWFKAYLLNAKNLLPSSKSNLMIVELIKPDNKLYKRIKISLVAGTGWGNFNLSDSLTEGEYRVRAYTNWMRNFDKDFYYDHTFKVGDIRSSQLLIKSNFAFQKSGEDELVNAKINYSNIGGNPYANKEVNYSVEVDGKTISKGKALTDAKGDANISFKNTKSDSQKNGIIKSSLAIAERTVINKVIPIANTVDDIDVQFFPEGGHMVNSIRSKVGFKAVGKDGLGKPVSGIVRNDKGEIVAKISTRNKGMGYFSFTPLETNTYIAKIDFSDGSSKEFPLPKAKEQGLVLSILPFATPDSIMVRVSGNMPAAPSNDSYTVIAQSNGNLIYSIKSKLSNSGGFLIKLPKLSFPTGISQFTLFGNNMEPLAERIVFINNQNTFLNLDLTADKEKYKKREQAILSLNSQMPGGKATVSSLSISVTNESNVPVDENEEHTIFSELLLNSDLKGYIENPNYYFNQPDEKKSEDLDVLMLTQGWRRFNWSNIINNVPQKFTFKPEPTLALKGRVTNNKKPVPNADLIVFTSKAGGIMQVKANANGEFNLDSLIFRDSTKFVIQARSEKGKKFVEIEMDDGYDKTIAPPRKPTLNSNINSSIEAYLKNSKTQYEELLKYGLVSRNILLNEVVISEKKAENENSYNLNGAGNADRVIKADELEDAVSLEIALQSRVAGLFFQEGEAYFARNLTVPVQIILDGIRIETDLLSSIHPQEVETIEVLKSGPTTAIYGSEGAGGIIIITTKRGSGGGFSNTYSPGIIAHNPLGLFTSKEFYVPAYDKPETNNNMADLRSTVYWNPTVITDSTGVAKVKYFNADGTGTYRVVVEGIDLRGHIGRKVMRYNVN